jgi:hypothetical protein
VVLVTLFGWRVDPHRVVAVPCDDSTHEMQGRGYARVPGCQERPAAPVINLADPPVTEITASFDHLVGAREQPLPMRLNPQAKCESIVGDSPERLVIGDDRTPEPVIEANPCNLLAGANVGCKGEGGSGRTTSA